MSNKRSEMPACKQCGATLESESSTSLCPKCLLMLGTTATEVEVPLKAGDMFHGMEVVQMLGRGGMGVVYKAKQPALDRFVAVKILPRHLCADAEFTDRFAREAKALAALSHPNIVTVHDFGKEGSRYFFVMEFVDGTNLRPLMAEGKLKPEEALKIVPVLCEALEYAHSEGVVHRDIKPENILVDKKGRVKIADFGLAKLVNSGETTRAVTQTGVSMGTPHYMAPEQYENSRNVDHRADIYSLGVLIYEMLTGELPIGRFSPPSKHSSVDARIDEVVMRALERQPDKRYQSMGDVKRDVTTISSGGTPSRASGGSMKWPLIGAAAVVLIVVGILAFQAGRNNPGKNTTAQQNPNPVAPPPSNPVDLWPSAKLEGSDAPPGWKIKESRESESRSDVLEGAAWWGLKDKADQIDAWRRADLVGPDEQSIRVFAYKLKSTPGLDACLQLLHKNFLPQYNLICFEKETTIMLISGDKAGRVTPAIEALEDRLRMKLKMNPAKREDPSRVLDSDFPLTTEAWTGKDEEFTAKDPNLRDGWSKSFIRGRGTLTLNAQGFRFFESSDAKKLAQTERVREPAENEERRVIHGYEHVVVLSLQIPDPAKRDDGLRVLDSVAEAVRKRTRGELNPTSPQAEPLDWKLETQALTVPFLISGLTTRELRQQPEWKIDAWGAWRDGFETAIKTPELAIDGDKRTGTLKVPIEGATKLFFQTQPDWMTVRIHWHPKDEHALQVQLKLEGKLPAEFNTAFGRAILTEKDMPPGWRQVDNREKNEQPLIAIGADEKNRVLSIFDADQKVDRAAVELAYADAIEPEEKLPGFDSARFYLLKFNNADAQKQLLARLKDHPPGMADVFKVHSAGDTVMAAFFYGSNADALRVFEKVRENMKKKLGAE